MTLQGCVQRGEYPRLAMISTLNFPNSDTTRREQHLELKHDLTFTCQASAHAVNGIS